jgi:CBS domain containing-hemolysin-like protein
MIKNIMIPRSQMLACPDGISLEEITRQASASPYSRIPIYRDSIDNIIGIVHIRDLFFALNTESDQTESITDLLRPVQLFPETVSVKEVFAALQTSRNQVSIILDEFGGTSGMVTLEDLVEEIFGDIQDEFDEEPPQILILGESGFLILGSTPIDEINALLGIDLEAHGIDTIGGLITGELGRIPVVNDRVLLSGHKFTIHQMQDRAVLSTFMAASPEIIEYFRRHR